MRGKQHTELGVERLVEKLCRKRSLSLVEYELLVAQRTPKIAQQLAARAVEVRKRVYGTKVFTRGLIEASSYCKNDCLYCGIRRSNRAARRYRLSPDEIVECANNGYELGFRTFVVQGGEDSLFTDDVLRGVVSRIREAHPDCAVTLSFGERSPQSYARLRAAGAERYLLRHETASPELYARWHPSSMSFDNRMRCLGELRAAGFAVGAGFMVGAPFQTAADLARDLKFIELFKPEMCGIGPFIPHHATPFASYPPGSVELTCYVLSIIRIVVPNVLLPATTALGTIDARGRELGVLSGANVVMPNLSPVAHRKDYDLYDNKICTGEEAAECRGCLGARMLSIGCQLVVDRGDVAPLPQTIRLEIREEQRHGRSI